MMGYHIPTLARERILKGIAIMAQQQAATVLIDSKLYVVHLSYYVSPLTPSLQQRSSYARGKETHRESFSAPETAITFKPPPCPSPGKVYHVSTRNR
jgi:hypothetical protein